MVDPHGLAVREPDRDPYAGPPGAIGETRVALTYVGGARVYAAPDA
ncbi:hypothetical protein ACFYZE_23020 [Streptomyces sp. NPDC001796]